MRITDVLLGEHGYIYMALDLVETRLGTDIDLDDIKASARVLDEQLSAHSELEDELLFGALDPRLAANIQELRKEHIGIERAFRGVCAARTRETAMNELKRTMELVRRHLAKEERVLFPAAHQVLTDSELRTAGGKWATLRGVYIPEPVLVRKSA